MLSITKKMILLPLKIKMIEKNTEYGMLSRISKTILLVSFTFFAAIMQAQTMEVGAFVGTSYYVGELNPGLPYNQTKLAYGVLARYNSNPRWALKFNYYRGDVQGSDATGGSVIDRELNFKSKINDFSVVAEFNFWEYFTGSKRSFFTPFIFGGVSFFTFKPMSQSGVDLQPLGTEGQNIGFADRSPYKQYSLALPFGFGFKYSLSKTLALTFEWGMRKTLTDYIDDVSTTYYLDGPNADPNNIGVVSSDPTLTHESYMQRGDEGTKDWYNYTGITFTYKFNLYSNKRCNVLHWK